MSDFTYRVALKAPGGTKYIQLGSPLAEWRDLRKLSPSGESQLPIGSRLPDINLWLGANLHRRKWKHHLLYNDEPPTPHTDTETAHSSGGHCKGVLVWDDTHVGWLVHSTPKWPAAFTDPLPPIGQAQTEYGQSFVYIEVTVDKLDAILAQIALMGAHVYVGAPLANNRIPANHIELAYGVCWHVAKSPANHVDFYETYLPQFLGGAMACQTWGRPLLDSTDHVKNIRSMQWAATEPVYVTTQDHSKFAVSMDWRCPHVYIGDLNHMHSQEHRGGGGIVLNDYALWQAFHDIIVDYSSIEANKQKGQTRGALSWAWARVRPYWAQCCGYR